MSLLVSNGRAEGWALNTGGVTVSPGGTIVDIHVDKKSEIPVHEQLSAQLVFLIGTGQLKPGRLLPSVRALAQRLAIHRNTVSRAYRDLILGLLVEKRAGRRFAVRAVDPRVALEGHSLDGLLDVAIAEARGRGYSLQQLYERLGERVKESTPARLLVISEDAGMRMLLPQELRQHFACPVHACTPDELLAKAEWALGSVVVVPQGHLNKIRAVLAPHRPVIPITYSPADGVLDAIRNLDKPSLITVVSVSAYFLEMALRLLAAAAGTRHSINTDMMTGARRAQVRAADVVVCDVVVHPWVRRRYKAPSVIVYKTLSPSCIDMISAAMSRASSE